MPLAAGKFFKLLKNNFCLQSSKFSVKYFLKPAEINGDCIFYLNGQRAGVKDTSCSYKHNVHNLFFPKKFLDLDVLKAVKPFLLLVGFRRILNYTEQMLKQMDTVFWKSGKKYLIRKCHAIVSS